MDTILSKQDLIIEKVQEMQMQYKKQKISKQSSITLFVNNSNQNNVVNTSDPNTTVNHQNATVAGESNSNSIPNNNNLPKNQFIDLKSAMFQWYEKNLFKIPFNQLTTDEKSTLHKCSKIITYMKLFIPSDCKLFSIVINVADHNNYNNWIQELHSLCHNTEVQVMTFLNNNHYKK